MASLFVTAGARHRLLSSLLSRRLLPFVPCALISPQTASRPVPRSPLFRRALSAPRREDPDELRLDVDGRPKTRSEFIRKYNGVKKWSEAAGRRYVELRFDTDGEAYSKAEFVEFYGGSDRDGVAYEQWDASKHFAHQLTNLIKRQRRVEDVLELHHKCSHGMNDIHVSTCWHHLCLLASTGRTSRDEHRWLLRNGGRLATLCGHTFAMMPLLDAQGLSNISYGLAKVGLAEAELFDALALEAAPRLGEFKAQALSNVAWAYATAKHASPALFDALALEAAPRLGEFDPQHISNVAWAYATAKHASPALFDRLHVEVKRRGGVDSFRDKRDRTMLSKAFAWAQARSSE